MREMRDSGVPWLMEIPDNWKVERGKNVLALQKRPVRDDDEVVTCFRDGEVILRSLRRTEGFTMSDKEIGYQGINEGDIVIHGMDGFAGAMGVSKSTGKGSPVLIVCTPKYDAIPQYIIYYLRALAMTDVFVALATGIRERSCDLRWNKVSELEFIMPSSSEQQRIAEFLDSKCAEVDEMIGLQEQIIEELKAYKQSVITEAVTKGLNPNVPMRDSGIEWIGQIPEHWKFCRLKAIILKIESGVSVNAGGDFSDDANKYVLKTSCVSRNVFIYTECKKVEEYDSHRVSCPVKAGTLIVSRMNTPELVGTCGYCENDIDNIFLPDRLWQVSLIAGMHAKFFWYLLIGNTTRNYLSSLSTGTSSSMQNISQPQFANTPITIPSIQEQQAIADYLDEKCADIDSLIQTKQSKIDSLKEYKKSIIYEYVTGKREV